MPGGDFGYSSRVEGKLCFGASLRDLTPFGILNAGSSALAGLVPVEFVSSTEPV
jgi:hypothetical protein